MRTIALALAAMVLAAFAPAGRAYAQTGTGTAIQKDLPSTAGVGNPGGRGMRGMRVPRMKIRHHRRHHRRMM